MLAGIAVFFGMLLGGMTSVLTNMDARRADYVHRFHTIQTNMVTTITFFTFFNIMVTSDLRGGGSLDLSILLSIDT